MKILFGLLVVVSIAGCAGPSQDEIAVMSDECRLFIRRNMDVYLENIKIFDTWTKDGAVVFEVGYKPDNSDTSSYAVRKCVVDYEKGTIFSPSPLNDSEWRK